MGALHDNQMVAQGVQLFYFLCTMIPADSLPNTSQPTHASWLLGESISMTEIQPSELSLDPIRADALILLESDKSILHIEFQTLPKNAIPFRVLDYRVRMYRKDPTKLMPQE